MRLKISLEMMKRAFYKDMANTVHLVTLVVKMLVKGEDHVEEIAWYLFEILGLEKEEFMRIMRDEVNVDRDVEVKMISLADRLRQEGIEKGIEKGIQKGAFLKALQTCRKLLLMGLSPSDVSDATELPLEKVLEIQNSLNNSN